mgnify:CR=1 FL=1
MDKAIRDRYGDAILQEVAARYGQTPGALTALGGFESFIYRFDDNGAPVILRVTHSLRRSPDLIRGEVDWINALAMGGAAVARALLSARGELVEEIDDGAGGCFLATAFAFAPPSFVHSYACQPVAPPSLTWFIALQPTTVPTSSSTVP